MGDIQGRKVSITATARGTGSIVVDGVDISEATRGATLRVDAGRTPSLTLDLHVREEAQADGEVVVLVDQWVHEALVAIGWTPPA